MTFFWIIRSIPAMPIADRRAPIVVGIKQTSSATSTVTVTGVPCPAAADAVQGIRQQGGRREQEDDGERRQQDVERDLVRRLLPLGALDQRDHPVQEGLARVRGDLHDDPVGEHLRPAGDGAAIAAGLADHGRALARDRRLVHRGDAVDDLPVGGDEIVGLDEHDVTLPEHARRRRHRTRCHGRRCARGRRAGAASPRGRGAPCGARPPAPSRVLPPSPRRSSRRGP